MKIWVSETLTSINGFSKLYQFEVEASKQISALKIDISNKILIHSSNFDLYRNDFLLDNNKSIESLQISESSILQICILHECSLNLVNVQETYLNINIKQFLQNETNGVKVEKFYVKSNCSIKEFYHQLKCAEKIHNLKSLYHLNRVLENDKTFQEYEIEDYDEIKLVDNVVLVNYENCLYDTQALRKLNLESEDLNNNLLQLSQVWNTDSDFISVIYDGKIVKEIPNGIYLSFICDGNDIGDSIIVFVTESLTKSQVISKHGILLNQSDLLSSTISKIRRSLNIENLGEIKIRFNDEILDIDKRLIDYGISNFSELVLVCRIYIEVFNFDQRFPFWICLGDKVSRLKSLIATSEIHKESYDLFFLGQNILDNAVLSKNGVEIESILTLIYCIENISISNLILIDYEFLNFIPDSVQIINLQSEYGLENRNMLSRNANIHSNFMRIFYHEEIIKSVDKGKYFYFTQNNDIINENVMIFFTEGFNENNQLKKHAYLFSKTMTVGSLKEDIKHLLNIRNLTKFKIQFDEVMLEKSKLLSQYEIRNGSELKLLRRISVKQLDSDEIETFWMCLDNSFFKLKKMISTKLEINLNEINLYYFGELISDEELLAKYETDIDYTVITIVITSDKIESIYRCILIDYENCIFNSSRLHQIDFQFEDGYENLKYLSEIIQYDVNLMFVIYNEEKVKKIPRGKYLCCILGDDDDTGESIIAYVEESFSKMGKITKHAILLNKYDSVNLIKENIIDYLQINGYEFEIRLNDVILNSDDTLLDYQIISGLNLSILFKINVTRLSSNDSYPFWVFPSDSISKLKQFISINLIIDVSSINLFFFGKLIPDEETLSENGILANSMILMSEEKKNDVYYVTLVNYKECYLPDNSEIDIDRIREINFKSNDVNENRYELSREINKNYNLINIFHEEKIVKVIPNGKYLYLVHDGNYYENSIIVYVKESLSTSGKLKTLPILINKTDKVSCVFEKIKKLVNCSEEELKIRFGEKVLENDGKKNDEIKNDKIKNDIKNDEIKNYEIKNGSELILLMRIFIKELNGNRNFSLFISLCDTVKYLKDSISSKTNINVGQIILSLNAKNLDDDKLCSDYDIDSGTTIMMMATIKGGKMTQFRNLKLVII